MIGWLDSGRFRGYFLAMNQTEEIKKLSTALAQLTSTITQIMDEKLRTNPLEALEPGNMGAAITRQNQTGAGEVGFIDEKQLLARLPISRRTLFAWRMTGKIPYVRLSGRRILFHWPTVEATLLRFQRGGQF